MPGELNFPYRYLDTDADRRSLVAAIQRVRQQVIELTERVPREKWYEPRYHGWSLAAMLGHLQLMDNLSLAWIKMALVGFRPPVPDVALNGLNDMMAAVYRRRVVETTVKGLRKQEAAITSFIMEMPIERYTVQVYYPPANRYLTIEQALQVMFLFHWEGHYQTMAQAEGIYYEPPPGHDTVV
jgi:hypothetical protein